MSDQGPTSLKCPRIDRLVLRVRLGDTLTPGFHLGESWTMLWPPRAAEPAELAADAIAARMEAAG